MLILKIVFLNLLLIIKSAYTNFCCSLSWQISLDSMKKWKRVSQQLNTSHNKSSADVSSVHSGSHQKYKPHRQSFEALPRQSDSNLRPSLNLSRIQHKYIRKPGSMSSIHDIDDNARTLRTENFYQQQSFNFDSLQNIQQKQRKNEKNLTDRYLDNFFNKKNESQQLQRYSTTTRQKNRQHTQQQLKEQQSIKKSVINHQINQKTPLLKKQSSKISFKLKNLQLVAKKLKTQQQTLRNKTQMAFKVHEKQFQEDFRQLSFIVESTAQKEEQQRNQRNRQIQAQCDEFFMKIAELNKQKQILMKSLSQL